jgi:dTDP-4-dehydrorhamnose reductase
MNLEACHYPVLVTGARGLLGHALGPRLLQAAPSAGTVHLTDLEELDVTNARAVTERVQRLKPRTIFHLAAWTDVDGAELRPAEAARLNVGATANVARAAVEAGALVVHLSTDFIFDGTNPGVYEEDDPPCPVSVYGRTKAESEAAVRAAVPADHIIARTAWLYGAGRRNFIDAILAAARRGNAMRVVADQVGCPTWSEDLAQALVALVAAGARGTYHVCGDGAASRWDLACEAIEAAGLRVPVEKISTADLPPAAHRPPRAVLSTARLARAVGFRLPPWRESVRAYVKSLAEPRGASTP